MRQPSVGAGLGRSKLIPEHCDGDPVDVGRGSGQDNPLPSGHRLLLIRDACWTLGYLFELVCVIYTVQFLVYSKTLKLSIGGVF